MNHGAQIFEANNLFYCKLVPLHVILSCVISVVITFVSLVLISSLNSLDIRFVASSNSWRCLGIMAIRTTSSANRRLFILLPLTLTLVHHNSSTEALITISEQKTGRWDWRTLSYTFPNLNLVRQVAMYSNSRLLAVVVTEGFGQLKHAIKLSDGWNRTLSCSQ